MERQSPNPRRGKENESIQSEIANLKSHEYNSRVFKIQPPNDAA
jgi:hypothetical protein